MRFLDVFFLDSQVELYLVTWSTSLYDGLCEDIIIDGFINQLKAWGAHRVDYWIRYLSNRPLTSSYERKTSKMQAFPDAENKPPQPNVL